MPAPRVMYYMSRQLAEPHLSQDLSEPFRSRITGPRKAARSAVREALLSALQTCKPEGGPALSRHTQASHRYDRYDPWHGRFEKTDHKGDQGGAFRRQPGRGPLL